MARNVLVATAVAGLALCAVGCEDKTPAPAPRPAPRTTTPPASNPPPASTGSTGMSGGTGSTGATMPANPK